MRWGATGINRESARFILMIFFRFFKQILGCRHLLSTRIEGIQIQVYAAVICCMMINALTGRKPNKWMVTLMSLYLSGLASDEDVLRDLNKPDSTGIKLRAKDELWKKPRREVMAPLSPIAAGVNAARHGEVPRPLSNPDH